MTTTRTALILLGFIALLISSLGHAEAPWSEKKHTKKVNCDNGGSVAKALKHAPAFTTILIKGTCYERITIKRDGIRLIGQAGASFDGSSFAAEFVEFKPLIRITDASKVLLKNLTVQYSPGEGVLIQGKATAKLKQMNVHDNTNVGLLIDHARVTVVDSTFDNNLGGIDSINNASTILRGQVSLKSNLVFGLAASNAASLELRGAVVEASQNANFGVIVEHGQLAILNFAASQGSQLLADQNGACGIAVVAGGLIDVIAPPPLHFSGVNLISAQNNGGCGMVMTTGSKIESPFGAATFQISGNAAGMQIAGNSDVFINGGLNITGNAGPGLIADGAGTLVLAPADGSPPPLLGTTIENNGGPDVIMSFGSRATFAGNVSIGALVCDGTALVRGSTTCP